jgi:hypothetical protein
MVKATASNYLEQESLICVTCGKREVQWGGGSCSTCQTPWEVSRSVAKRKKPCKFVTVVGASGAGKTVYLGMLLDMLTQGHTELKCVPNGAFSVSVQQQTVSALQQRRFPEKTAAEADQWNWVHSEAFHVRKPKQSIDIITPDLAGESIALELDQPGTYPAIRNSLRNSDAIVILIDSTSVRDNGRIEDHFGIKLLSYIASLQSAKERRGKISTPVAITFTKTDCCADARDNPLQFAQSNLSGLVQSCKTKLLHHQFFSASVVGGTATAFDEYGAMIQIPLHVEPRGIIEPFQWIINKI